MIEAPVYSQLGEKKGVFSLPKELFDLPWNESLIHQVVVSQQSNERAGTANTKFRNEVRGGGHKPWKQKGGGKARHGSRRSPIWVGGGITFGPRSEKSYEKSINKKMKTKSLFVVLSKKAQEKAIAFAQALSFENPKTKDAHTFIKAIRKENNDTKGTILIVLQSNSLAVRRSFNNLPKVQTTTIDTLNTKTAFSARVIVFEGTDSAVERLNKRI